MVPHLYEGFDSGLLSEETVCEVDDEAAVFRIPGFEALSAATEAVESVLARHVLRKSIFGRKAKAVSLEELQRFCLR